MALAFRIIVNKKKAVTYCQQALSIAKVFIKCSFALFVEYPLCFLLCHNLRLHMLKTCGIGKQFFLFHVLDLNPIFGNQDPHPLLDQETSAFAPA